LSVVSSHNALGDYLRARRDRVRPEDVGLVPGPRRRVPGLRREELAALAGISADYYLRIEQGRSDGPSAQVLDALARALRLDTTATAHLHALSAAAPVERADDITGDLVDLLDQLNVPAYVANRYLDCLASNPLARTLSPSFTAGRNLLRALLLDPAHRRLHVDWDAATASVVGGLRQFAGTDAGDPRLRSLVDELNSSSERFAELWERADVGYRPAGTAHLRHPELGDMVLWRNRFDVANAPGQHLHVYHADPGTAAVGQLDALRALTSE
jgi:transcriptional regulator with XRE-family HTH domain